MSIYRKIGRAGAAAKKKKTMARALSGLKRVVEEVIHHQKFIYYYISISHYFFELSKSLVSLENGAKNQVQCFLLHDHQHPNAYAKHALQSDPAVRLGIEINGKDIRGNIFAI